MLGITHAFLTLVLLVLIVGTIRILLLYMECSFFRHHLIRIGILVIGLTSTKVFTNIKSAPEVAGAFDLLLNLGGASLVDAVGSVFQQYTLLHSALARVVHEDYVSSVVARGPNLHQVCFDDPYTESPTSLAIYSSLAFGTWLNALVEAEVDLKSFIDQDLEQNLEVHADWEKATLLDLFTHGDRPDFHVTNFSECSDCKMCSPYEPLVVQPYWRHLLERIKRGLHARDPAQVSSELNGDKVADHDSLGEATSSLTDLTPKPDMMGDVPVADLEAISSESESEEDTSEYSRTSDIGSNCLYSKHEVVCQTCWLHYERTGTRGPPEDSPSSDDSSECEYSPFFIHS